MRNNSLILAVTGAVFGVFCETKAADPDNCLSCHRYQGLARVSDDGATIRSYHVDAEYYDRALGPHARLSCTDCHQRDEVAVIPHQSVSRVNCTSSCHLSSPEMVEMRFSHEHLADTLEDSVHPIDVLERCNELLGMPFGSDQSKCLMCHEEPRFRRGDTDLSAIATASIGRCAVCHDNRPAGELELAFWHVHARSEPARTSIELTQLCASCHSNEAVRAEFDLPDSTASYLASFHGKAMLLGSKETANCLDCHAAEGANVHVMKPPDDPASSVHRLKLADSCRSAACHPSAGAAISTAAIHMDLSTGSGIEYFIATIFVILIIFTFGPSVLLQSLELVQLVVGREDPRHHEAVKLARQLHTTPQGRHALKRFTPHQRVQHWILFVSFTLLVLTGFPIKFADRGWAVWLVDLFGGLTTARLIHRWAGALLIIGFGYHMLYVLLGAHRDKKRTGKSWGKTFADLPMVMNADDCRKLVQLLAYLLFLRKERPEGDRFNLKEKFEYFGVFWGSFLLGVTGLLMWANQWTTVYFTGRVLTIAALIHTFEAFLALLHVGVIHMIGVVFAPQVFPFSKAMVSGDTPEEELAEAHMGFLKEVSQKVSGAQTEGPRNA